MKMNETGADVAVWPYGNPGGSDPQLKLRHLAKLEEMKIRGEQSSWKKSATSCRAFWLPSVK